MLDYDLDAMKSKISKIYSVNDPSSDIKDRMCELKNIFTAQISALNKIKALGFFDALTDHFWAAFSMFLELAEVAKEANTDDLIQDSYTFIKSFDNALQGYLNSDRQFLEFPGHSVSLYDLPAKLGVYYTNLIDKIIASLLDNTEYRIAFLLCPEPFDEEGVHVSRLLFDPTEDDSKKKIMLVIEAPARLMFQPDKLSFALAHEISHYLGRKYRVFNAAHSIARNAMFYEIHRCALVSETAFVFGEIIMNSCIDNHIKDAFINVIDQHFSEPDIRIRKFSPLKGMQQPPTDLNFSSVDSEMNKCYAEPISAALDRVIQNEIDYTKSECDELGPQEGPIINSLKPLIVAKTKSNLVYVHKFVSYLIKESAADVLAIRLLGMEKEDYVHKIEEERANVLDNQNTRDALAVRMQFVVAACYDGKDELEKAIYFSDEIDSMLFEYLSNVYQSSSDIQCEDVASLYRKALAKESPSNMFFE